MKRKVEMAEKMIGIPASITRFISADQPGFVECEFNDAHGRCWKFVEKSPVVSAEYLDAQSDYPRMGIIACEITSRRQDATGREIVTIDTNRPWGIESVDGGTQFEVSPSSLVEWEWGSDNQRAWDGRA